MFTFDFELQDMGEEKRQSTVKILINKNVSRKGSLELTWELQKDTF